VAELRRGFAARVLSGTPQPPASRMKPPIGWTAALSTSERQGWHAALVAAHSNLAPVLPLLFVFAGLSTAPAADVFYHALVGEPDLVEESVLAASPGRHVGHAVRTRGRLERSEGNGVAFQITSGPARILLRLEPEAAALVRAHASSWVGLPVDVEGFFYREPDTRGGGGEHALRAWQVLPLGAAAEPLPSGSAPALSLEALVYAAGRYDGAPVRVRGVHRGSNLYRDLPEATRPSRGDWVLKDGYFAAWVSGPEPRGQDGSTEMGVAFEVLGMPTTVNGVVRLAAQHVEISFDPASSVVVSAVPSVNADWATVSPRVIFAYPVPGQPLGPAGHMIVQFSRPMDPSRLEAGVRIRYERNGVATGTPEAKVHYRDRYRALVITPEPPPPPGTDVVVELLDVVVDVAGRRLAGRESANEAEPVVERIRFRSGS
jgi:hypothetical protein